MIAAKNGKWDAVARLGELGADVTATNTVINIYLQSLFFIHLIIVIIIIIIVLVAFFCTSHYFVHVAARRDCPYVGCW